MWANAGSCFSAPETVLPPAHTASEFDRGRAVGKRITHATYTGAEWLDCLLGLRLNASRRRCLWEVNHLVLYPFLNEIKICIVFVLFLHIAFRFREHLNTVRVTEVKECIPALALRALWLNRTLMALWIITVKWEKKKNKPLKRVWISDIFEYVKLWGLNIEIITHPQLSYRFETSKNKIRFWCLFFFPLFFFKLWSSMRIFMTWRRRRDWKAGSSTRQWRALPGT